MQRIVNATVSRRIRFQHASFPPRTNSTIARGEVFRREGLTQSLVVRRSQHRQRLLSLSATRDARFEVARLYLGAKPRTFT